MNYHGLRNNPEITITMRGVYLVIGLFLLVLGFIGAFLPVLPTTPFLILAVACFARSSRRLENWLLFHPHFGPPLRQWRQRGAIPQKAKYAALFGTSVGFVLFWLSSDPEPWAIIAVAAIMLSGLAYVFSRPS